MCTNNEWNWPSDAKVMKFLRPNPSNPQNVSLSSIFSLYVLKYEYEYKLNMLYVIIYP